MSSPKKLHICHICGRQLSRSDSLGIHMRLHSGVLPYKCQHCPMAFRQNQSCKNHMEVVHGGDKPFKCKKCTASYLNDKNLSTHMKIAHGEGCTYTCSICKAVFVREENLKQHQSAIHAFEEKPLTASPSRASQRTVIGDIEGNRSQDSNNASDKSMSKPRIQKEKRRSNSEKKVSSGVGHFMDVSASRHQNSTTKSVEYLECEWQQANLHNSKSKNLPLGSTSKCNNNNEMDKYDFRETVGITNAQLQKLIVYNIRRRYRSLFD